MYSMCITCALLCALHVFCVRSGNQAEDDLNAVRRVFKEDVRDWCHGEGDVMPYLETSFAEHAEIALLGAPQLATLAS